MRHFSKGNTKLGRRPVRPRIMESIPKASPLPSLPTSSQPSRATSVPQAPESDFKSVLKRLAEHVDRGEALVQQVSRPHAGDGSAQLLALQAGIYRYTEVVDLSAKLVDRTTNSIKTTLQSQ